MNVTRSTYELLAEVLNGIDRQISISAAVDNTGGSYTLTTCNTLWATKGFTVTISGVDYVITDIDPNVSIDVSGPSLPPSPVSFLIYPPKFYHGTIKSTEQDLNKKVDGNLMSKDKLPMIWLHETVDEKYSYDPMDATARESRCNLYFMIDANYAQWTNENHYRYAIKPMRNLIQAFINALGVSPLVNKWGIGGVNVNDFPRWNVDLKSVEKAGQIFSAFSMSGCRVEMTIPFFDDPLKCC